MKLVLTLGRKFLDDPAVLTVEIPNEEINPDDVFRAANRIDDVPEDERGLAHAWQRRIRRLIDAEGTPSMSGGDTIELVSDEGMYLGGWHCDSYGWSIIDRTPS